MIGMTLLENKAFSNCHLAIFICHLGAGLSTLGSIAGLADSEEAMTNETCQMIYGEFNLKCNF